MIAFVAEPVVGATMGAVPPVPGYFRAVRAICDRYGMLLILDEVMCGMGRTGTLFACEQEGVRPDLVTIAKGLGAGYQAIGATLVIARDLRRHRGRLGLLPARLHLHGAPDRVRGGPGGAAGDRRGAAARSGAATGRPAARAPGRALRRPCPRRRHPRDAACSGARAGRRSGEQTAVRAGAPAACPRARPRPWRAA